jgi:hypothetical protein
MDPLELGVFPIKLHFTFEIGRLHFKQEWINCPLNPKLSISERLRVSGTKQVQLLGCELCLLAQFSPRSLQRVGISCFERP